MDLYLFSVKIGRYSEYVNPLKAGEYRLGHFFPCTILIIGILVSFLFAIP